MADKSYIKSVEKFKYHDIVIFMNYSEETGKYKKECILYNGSKRIASFKTKKDAMRYLLGYKDMEIMD